MKTSIFYQLTLIISLVLGLSACGRTGGIYTGAVEKSDPAAVALWRQSCQAHGEPALRKNRAVQVGYVGEWSGIARRIQPVLTDPTYRQTSQETIWINRVETKQVHRGPAGEKEVQVKNNALTVKRNGTVDDNPESRAAAALVIDYYRLFLLGPMHFSTTGQKITWTKLEATEVDGAPCDQLLAICRPGFGFSDEDRVVLRIDQKNRLLRQIRFTLNGTESTKGAEAEVTFRNFEKNKGVILPRQFVERVRVPFDILAHTWRMTTVVIAP
jgi:hypothetical protein